jgi:hypothetical protein
MMRLRFLCCILSGHREGGNAGRDYQLCPVPAKAGGGAYDNVTFHSNVLQYSSENRAQSHYHSSSLRMQFLAMKLSTVNPWFGVSVESLVAKDVSNHPQLFFTPFLF